MRSRQLLRGLNPSRHPFLQPRECHAAAGNRPWQGFFERSGRHVHALSKTLGKVGVLVGNCRGFVRQSPCLVLIVAKLSSSSKKGGHRSGWTRRFPISAWRWDLSPLVTSAGLDVGWRIRKGISSLGRARDSPAVRRRPSLRPRSLWPEKLLRAGTSTTTSGVPPRIRLSGALIHRCGRKPG